MLIILENYNIFFQTLFFKIIDSRDHAVLLLEKVVICPVIVNISMGSDFFKIGCHASKLKTKIVLTN